MSLSNSTVNLTLEDYTGLQEAKRQAENEAADLRKQLTEARLDIGNDGSTRALVAGTRKALDIVRFAVANLPPETVHNWPVATLVEVSHHIEKLPDATSDDVSFAIELRKFATECDLIARQRQAMRATQKVEIVDMKAGLQ